MHKTSPKGSVILWEKVCTRSGKTTSRHQKQPQAENQLARPVHSTGSLLTVCANTFPVLSTTLHNVNTSIIQSLLPTIHSPYNYNNNLD